MPDADPFSAWLDDKEGDGAATTLTAVQGFPAPDKVAQGMRLAEELDLPPTVLEDINAQRQKAAEAKRAREAMVEAPALTAWMAEPDNAAVSHDDTDQLAWWEKGLKAVAPLSKVETPSIPILGAGLRMAGRGAQAVEGAVYTARHPELVAADVAGMPQAFVEGYHETQRMLLADKVANGRATPEEKALWERQFAAAQAQPRLKEGPLSMTARQLPQMAETVARATPEIATGMGAGAMFGTVVPGVGNVTGGLTGAGVGATAGSFKTTVALNTGAAYEEFSLIRDEAGKPLDPDTVRLAAQTSGVLAGSLDVVGFGAFVRLVGGVVPARSAIKQMLSRPTVREGLAKIAGKYATVIATETGTEAAQEAIQLFTGELQKDIAEGKDPARTFARPSGEEVRGRIVEAGVQGGTVAAVMGALPAGAGATVEVGRAQQAKQAQQVFEAIAENAGSSKLKERLPQKYQAFVDQVTRDGPVPNIYVSGDAVRELFQSQGVDPSEGMIQLGLNPQDLKAALLTGGDVAIPTGTWAAKIAGTDIDKGLREYAKLAPDAMSAAEMREFEANEPQMVQAIREQEAAAAKAEAEASEEDKAVIDGIVGRLSASGRFTPDQARKQATILHAFLKRQAIDEGVTTAELAAQYPVEIKDTMERRATPAAPADIAAVIRAGAGDVSPDYLTALASRESSFRPTIAATTSSAAGLYQFVDKTWVNTVASSGLPGMAEAAAIAKSIKLDKNGRAIIENEQQRAVMAARLDPKAATHAAAALTQENARALRNKLGRDPNDAELYIAHFMGSGGAGKLLTADPGAEAAGLFKREARANPTIFYQGKGDKRRARTVAEVVAELGRTFTSDGVNADASFATTPGGTVAAAVDDVSLPSLSAAVANVLPDGGRELAQAAVDTATTPEFRAWFGDSRAVDERGAPVVLFHGTTSEFEAFDTERANIESDWGAGVYFSNTPVDVAANYAGQGPDLTIKIDLVAERIANETDRRYDDPDVIAEAKERLAVQHGGATVPAYLSLQNPVIVGGPDETFLDFTSHFDPEAEEDGEPSGKLLDFVQALRDVAGEFDEVDIDQAITDLMEDVYDQEGITARKAQAVLRASEGLAYATTDRGGLASHEIIRRAFEAIGFDGVIDRTVNDKFGLNRRVGKRMVGVHEGTVHYVAFKPEQVKSIFNRGTFDPNDARILYQAQGPFYSGLARAVLGMSTTRASADQWKATISKAPGVKKEELEWSGLTDWLDLVAANGPIPADAADVVPVGEEIRSSRSVSALMHTDASGMVSRVNIIAFLDANGVKVEEVVLGETSPAKVERLAEQLQQEALDALLRTGGLQPHEDFYALDVEEEGADGAPLTRWRVVGDGSRELFDTEEDAQARADELNSEQENDVVTDWLSDTYAEFEAKAEDELGNTQFSDYKTPGADDTYRELLLTLPAIGGPATHWDQANVVAHTRFTERKGADGKRVLFVEEVQSDWHQKGRDKGYQTPVSDAEIEARREEYELARKAWREAATELVALAPTLPGWEERRPAAYRNNGLSEHVALEELPLMEAANVVTQSLFTAAPTDPGDPFAQATPALRAERATRLAVNEARQQYDNALVPRGIPNAPFKTAWPALVMKRLIRWAVDNGFERVAWTTGEQQADRYNLSQAVGSIDIAVRPDGTYRVDTGNRRAVSLLVENGVASEYDGYAAVMSADQLREAFGGEIATKLIEGELASRSLWEGYDRLVDDLGEADAAGDEARAAELRREIAQAVEAQPTRRGFRLEGTENLRVGGEGMKAFYDRNLVNITNDLIKKHGVRVGPVEVMLARDDAVSGEIVLRRLGVAERDIAARWATMSQEERDRLFRMHGETPDIQPGFDITEELAAAARQGFALFQKAPGGEPVKRGSIVIPETFGRGGTATINLFEAANLSTFAHETGHFMLEVMAARVQSGRASDQVQKDFRAVLDWLNVPDAAAIGVAEHEKWAEGVEQYLREGRAPSPSLMSTFESFRAWLTHLYRALRGVVRADLTDDVREVMDRLLATDEEIAQARLSQGMDALFADPETDGMSPEMATAYRDLVRRAVMEAHAEADARVQSAVNRQTKAWWQEEKERTREEVAREVAARPVYRAFEWLAHGTWAFGEPPAELKRTKLNRKAIVDDYGKDWLKRLPRGFGRVYGEDGDLHPDDAAAIFGFGSGQEMMQALEGMERKGPVIARETDERMTAKHGDPMVDGTLPDVALNATHNVSQQRVIEMELAHLQGRRVMSGLREAARREVANRQVRDVLSPDRHLTAERKAANAAQQAFKKGDLAEAATQKFRQLVSFHTWRATRDAKDEVEKGLAYLKKFDRPGVRRKLDGGYIEQIDELLDGYDLRKMSRTDVRAMESLAAFAARMEAEGTPATNIDPAMLERANRKHYTTLTLDEMRGLIATVQNIDSLGRLKRELLDRRERRDREALIQEAIDQTYTMADKFDPDRINPRKGRTWTERRAGELRGLDAEFIKIETFLDWLDGQLGVTGVFNRVLLQPAVNAANHEGVMQERVGQVLRSLYEGLPKDQRRLWNNKVSIPELINAQTGRPFDLTRKELVAVALNVGNASNFDKLVGGYEWDGELVMEALNRELTAQEWGFVQGVWDALETLWPDIEAAERRLVGQAPERVEPREVATPHGILRGGYYPVVYDSDRSDMARRNAAKDAVDMFAGIFSSASTPTGHTQKRTAVVAPITLDVEGVIFGHVNKVIKRAAFGEFIISARSFILDPRIAQIVQQKVGLEYYDQLMPWLQRQVNDRLTPAHAPKAGDRVMKAFRVNGQMVAMGFRGTTMLAQLAGFPSSTAVIGMRWMGRGLAEGMGRGGRDVREFIHGRSEEMRQRSREVDRDLREAWQQMEGRDSKLNDLRRLAFMGIGFMDATVSNATWLGAYYKAMEAQGLTEEEAIAAADKAVRMSQGSGRPAHLAAIQSGGEATKLFTMFYSYFSVQYQRQRDMAHDAETGDWGKAFITGWWFLLVAPIMGAALTGDWPQDDEELWAWFARKVFYNTFAGVPLLRDVASYTERMTTGQFATFGATPLARAGDTVEKAIRDVAKVASGEEPPDRSIKHLIEPIGYFVNAPTGQLANTTQYWWDVFAADRQHPDHFGEFLFGTLKGPQEDQE